MTNTPQTSQTLVIFRKFAEGDVIALFPYDPVTSDPYMCDSYMRYGQHGSADPQGLIHVTKPATETEYAELKTELESAPYKYNLRVVKRLPSDAIKVRCKALQSKKAGTK
jgi:hypothetical protein